MLWEQFHFLIKRFVRMNQGWVLNRLSFCLCLLVETVKIASISSIGFWHLFFHYFSNNSNLGVWAYFVTRQFVSIFQRDFSLGKSYFFLFDFLQLQAWLLILLRLFIFTATLLLFFQSMGVFIVQIDMISHFALFIHKNR